MASATALESPSQERSVPDTSAQPSSHLRGGAHGRGRGRGSGLLDGVRGAGRGRSRGRGNRGARGPDSGFLHSRQGSGHMNPLPGQSSRPQDRPTSNGEPAGSPGGKIGPVAEIKGAGAKEQDVEAEVCFICASNVIHNSVAPCNHRTCHICALRLRALYKTRACAHCRTEAKYVIFTNDSNKRYEDFADSDFEKTDDVLGIKYEQNDIFDDTVLLLRYNCPADDCDVACWGWPDLHRHVKGVHHKVLCDLCTRNKKVFTHEHELFTPQELRRHEKFGDDNPGAVDQSGFKGHPQCGFCVQRFYSDDELYAHCKEKHERCFICDRRNQGRQQQYYLDYNALEEHYRREHFICPDQECIDKHFIVFESEMDLKAHQLEEHPNGLTKDARRDARRVDISGFDYRAPHHDDRGGRRDRERDGRGRGRGRDPNTEPLPMSTAQSLRRDEIAYQRQMALQNAQTRPSESYAARPTNRNQSTISTPRQPPSNHFLVSAIENVQLNTENDDPLSSNPPTSLTPQEQARNMQHVAVLDRASAMMNHDQTKISDFRTSVSSYKTSKISAAQFIDTLFTLLDVPSVDLGKLIKELAELYDNDAKRAGLLKAWNDWRAINEDYPSLPEQNSVLSDSSASGASNGGKRVLRLKSSTAQSSRSAVSKQGSWGKGLANSVPTKKSGASTFPALPASSSRPSTTPWATASPSVPRIAAPIQSSSNSRTQTSAPLVDAFPALPAAARPNTLMAGLTRGSVRWDDHRSGNSTPGLNPWAGASSTNSTASIPNGAAGDYADEEVANAGGKRKGNKNKKQTLYKFG